MPLKKTIIAALCAVVLLAIPLTVLLLLPDASDEAPEVTDAPLVQTLIDLNHVDHIESVRFTREGKESVSITHTDDGWQITDRPGLPVDPHKVALMLSCYEQVLALRTVTQSCNDPAEYGLDTPVLTLTLSDHGETKTYRFGDRNTYYEGYYCMIEGTEGVYLLDYAYVTSFDLTAEDLLLVEQLPDLSKIERLEWRTASGTVVEDTDALCRALADLSIDRMVDHGSEQYSVYGLDRASVATITLLQGGELRLRLCEGESEELIYLTVNDREIIYLVTCKDAEVLRTYLRME